MPITPTLMHALTDPVRELRGVDEFLRVSVGTLAQALGAGRAVFVQRAADGARPRDVHFVGWPAGSGTRYLEHHWRHDPIRHWLQAAAAGRAGTAIRLSALVPARQLDAAPWYRDLMAPAGARHVLSVALRENDAVTGVLSLVRAAGERDFTARDEQLAATLAPVLALAYGCARDRADDARLSRLTPRERDVFAQLLRGQTNKEIARVLAVSPYTVKNLMRGVLHKLGVRSRLELCARHAAAGPPRAQPQRPCSSSAAASPDQCD